MIYILFQHGQTLEVPEADSAKVEGMQLVCRDASGHVVKTFVARDVGAYGKHPAFAPAPQ